MSSATKHMGRLARQRAKEAEQARKKANPGGRRLKRTKDQNLLAEWQRDLSRRGFNSRSVRDLAALSFTIFRQENRRALEKGVTLDSVFFEGFVAGIRSQEFATKEARESGRERKLVDETVVHLAEVEKRSGGLAVMK